MAKAIKLLDDGLKGLKNVPTLNVSFAKHNEYFSKINDIAAADRVIKIKAGTGIKEIDSIYDNYFKNRPTNDLVKKNITDANLHIRRGELIEGLTLFDETAAKKLQTEQPNVVAYLNDRAKNTYPDADLVVRKTKMEELKNRLQVTDTELNDALVTSKGIENLRKKNPKVDAEVGKYDKLMSGLYKTGKVGIYAAVGVAAGLFLKEYAEVNSGCFMITKNGTCKITQLSCCSPNIGYDVDACQNGSLGRYDKACDNWDTNSSKDCCNGKCTYSELKHLDPNAAYECRTQGLLEALFQIVSGSLQKLVGKGLFGGIRSLLISAAVGGIVFGGSYVLINKTLDLDKKIIVIISACCGLLSFLITWTFI